jgi:hypothetical protein
MTNVTVLKWTYYWQCFEASTLSVWNLLYTPLSPRGI